tara:strand:+ start:421 stop:573 length:153 start_codon:yes stop_codon:yes gene_type:complete
VIDSLGSKKDCQISSNDQKSDGFDQVQENITLSATLARLGLGVGLCGLRR